MTGKRVLLKTNMGDITIELAEDMPVTAGNYEKLVSSGYYNGTIFHRVINGFMIQGGDPAGTGYGGPGYTIRDEFSKTTETTGGQFRWRMQGLTQAEASSSSTSQTTTFWTETPGIRKSRIRNGSRRRNRKNKNRDGRQASERGQNNHCNPLLTDFFLSSRYILRMRRT